MADTTYNGWTNYETWLVHLHIDNTEPDQSYWTERAEDCVAHTKDDDDPRGNAVCALSNELEDAICNRSETLCNGNTLLSDLLRAAMAEVNWDEIARHYIDAVLEEV